MVKNFNKLIILLLFIYPFSSLYSHERIAKSPCNIFIDKIINNYQDIKDHYYVGYKDDMYGFAIENVWDPSLTDVSEDGRKIIGKSKFRRDKFFLCTQIFDKLFQKRK